MRFALLTVPEYIKKYARPDMYPANDKLSPFPGAGNDKGSEIECNRRLVSDEDDISSVSSLISDSDEI